MHLIAIKITNVLIFILSINSLFVIANEVNSKKPRPKFEGPLERNDLLDKSEVLFKNEFHGPESMAWTNDKRSFYTGVEGGFILHVEPYEERWSIEARLNSRRWPVQDHSVGVEFANDNINQLNKQSNNINSNQFNMNQTTTNNSINNDDNNNRVVPFCEKDVELYGSRAEFEPKLVYISRCSRPLGIKISPDNSYLYTIDPLNGIYRIQLKQNNNNFSNYSKVTKIVDFSKYHLEENEQKDFKFRKDKNKISNEKIIFGDDIAIDWSNGENNSDIIYMTDCSKRYTLRYLIRVLAENDDTGRIIKFNSFEKKLFNLNNITPVIDNKNKNIDYRNLSFPNGIELNSQKDALIISDLNNRRIIKHFIKGYKSGKSEHLLWIPGYPDNIRRGLDSFDGKPTYWVGCGCAVSDGKYELAEFFNDKLEFKNILLNTLHYLGSTIETLGSIFNHTSLKDSGYLIRTAWLKKDPYCKHGIVIQFNEDGKILRSLHSQKGNFRLISEAHEVPILEKFHDLQQQQHQLGSSQLFLGSVYYSYLGKVQLNPLN